MSKRLKQAKEKIDKTKKYPIDEAVKLVKETATVKFDATIEFHAKLGIDVKKSDQQVRDAVKLPHGTGKTKVIAAFVGPDKMKEAKEVGAQVVGGEDLIQEIKKTGKINFEVAVATPDMMPKLAVIAKNLGQKGLMPNPKSGTITPDIKKIITDLKEGLVTIKNDSSANVHCPVGKVSFTDEKLVENITVLTEDLKRMKPDSLKGSFIRSAYLSSAMGPSIPLDIN